MFGLYIFLIGKINAQIRTVLLKLHFFAKVDPILGLCKILRHPVLVQVRRFFESERKYVVRSLTQTQINISDNNYSEKIVLIRFFSS